MHMSVRCCWTGAPRLMLETERFGCAFCLFCLYSMASSTSAQLDSIECIHEVHPLVGKERALPPYDVLWPATERYGTSLCCFQRPCERLYAVVGPGRLGGGSRAKGVTVRFVFLLILNDEFLFCPIGYSRMNPISVPFVLEWNEHSFHIMCCGLQ